MRPPSSFPERFFGYPLTAFALCGLMPVLLASCYAVRPTHGGGETGKADRDRAYSAMDIALPAGYVMETVATGLTYPTALVFDDTGGLYVVESGYAYGDDYAIPRLLKVMGPNLFSTVAASPDSNGPWTGAAYVPGEAGKGHGTFYVAEGGHKKGGRILRVGGDGSIEPLVENLPSFGDHHTNCPALGPDGMIYFSQGAATNSGVVGEDNAKMGWLRDHPEFHDTPCQDVTLSGVNYRTPDARGGKGEVETGAFSAYGTKTAEGQVIAGEIPCNGAILRIPALGSRGKAGANDAALGKMELVAWGFRNPFALGFAPDGRLYAIDNGYDERGSRPIWGAGELVFEVHQGRWYGWPDYSGDKSVDHAEFTPPHGERPRRLLQKPPGPWLATQAAVGRTAPEAVPELPPAPAAVLPVHASADGMDFSTSEAFGFRGQAFVAEFGDMAPQVGKVLEPVGFKIVRVDLSRGVAEDFAVNRKGGGPASRGGSRGLERPIAVKFSPDGNSLYVADFGVLAMDAKGSHAHPRTGAIWRIRKEGWK